MSLIIDHIDKSYDVVQALRQVDFEVNDGELFGLIGPDGAGKSTLFRIMSSLVIPDAGRCLMHGFDVVKDYREVRKIIGYMPGRFSLYMDLSVEENLAFYARVFGTSIDENYDLIRDVYEQIAPFKKRLAGKLSGGMKQKLALSCALIHTPDILLLDEPTFGVDPVSRQEFWQILHSIQKDGTTILVSTAYMDEATQCDRVALLFDGKLQALDAPQVLRDNYQYPLYTIESSDLRQLAQSLSKIEQIHSIQLFGDSLHVSFYQEPEESFWQALETETNNEAIKRTKIEASIEDVFLSLMETNTQ